MCLGHSAMAALPLSTLAEEEIPDAFCVPACRIGEWGYPLCLFVSFRSQHNGALDSSHQCHLLSLFRKRRGWGGGGSLNYFEHFKVRYSIDIPKQMSRTQKQGSVSTALSPGQYIMSSKYNFLFVFAITIS